MEGGDEGEEGEGAKREHTRRGRKAFEVSAKETNVGSSQFLKLGHTCWKISGNTKSTVSDKASDSASRRLLAVDSPSCSSPIRFMTLW
jgi:hypothetical protein